MSGRCGVKPFGRFVLKPLWFYIFAPLFRRVFKVRAYGGEVLKREGPLIVAPNHRSYIDPPLIASVAPEPLVFLAKKELKSIVYICSSTIMSFHVVMV